MAACNNHTGREQRRLVKFARRELTSACEQSGKHSLHIKSAHWKRSAYQSCNQARSEEVERQADLAVHLARHSTLLEAVRAGGAHCTVDRTLLRDVLTSPTSGSPYPRFCLCAFGGPYIYHLYRTGGVGAHTHSRTTTHPPTLCTDFLSFWRRIWTCRLPSGCRELSYTHCTCSNLGA